MLAGMGDQRRRHDRWPGHWWQRLFPALYEAGAYR